MPILEYHLADGEYSEEQCERLIIESSKLYAEVLKSPIDRVRVFIHLHKRFCVATYGIPMSKGGVSAPYFHFLVLRGRSLDERHRLLGGFTDLVVQILGAERGLIRGGCWPIPPEDWSIGGSPASELRAAEVSARAKAENKASATDASHL